MLAAAIPLIMARLVVSKKGAALAPGVVNAKVAATPTQVLGSHYYLALGAVAPVISTEVDWFPIGLGKQMAAQPTNIATGVVVPLLKLTVNNMPS